MSVRPAQPADAAHWARLRHELWPGESAGDLEAEAAAFFERPTPFLAQVLVAEAPGGGLAGFAELSLRAYAEGCASSPVGFLEGWYVSPAWRGQGVGAALVTAAEHWAREAGCTEFASDTQLDNADGAAAHIALGFEEVERLRCFRKSLDDLA